jgi:hypothetical protein
LTSVRVLEIKMEQPETARLAFFGELSREILSPGNRWTGDKMGGSLLDVPVLCRTPELNFRKDRRNAGSPLVRSLRAITV